MSNFISLYSETNVKLYVVAGEHVMPALDARRHAYAAAARRPR